MRPVRLTLSGQYWDSHIYMGRLYLFDRSGDLIVVNWDKLVDSTQTSENLAVVKECALKHSDYLYEPFGAALLDNAQIRSLLHEHFEVLATTPLEVASRQLDIAIRHKQSSPFPFPHADCTIYRSHFYSAGRGGVFTKSCNSERDLRDGSADRRWDAPTSSCAAAVETVALAAGENGLFEMLTETSPVRTVRRADPHLVVQRDCTECSWAFYDVFGYSQLSGSFLAQFKWVKSAGDQREDDDQNYVSDSPPPDRRRVFESLVTDAQLFGPDHGLTWCFQDKMYHFADRTIRILGYNPRAKKNQPKFSDVGRISVAEWKGDLVATRASVFGIVMEFDHALVVIESDGTVHTIPGEPVNWRVFPKSQNYRNHLHVVYRDHIDVYSWNSDYFTNQKTKKVGSRYSVVSGGR